MVWRKVSRGALRGAAYDDDEDHTFHVARSLGPPPQRWFSNGSAPDPGLRACLKIPLRRAGSAGQAGQISVCLAYRRSRYQEGSRPRHIDHTPREGNAAPRSPPPQPGARVRGFAAGEGRSAAFDTWEGRGQHPRPAERGASRPPLRALRAWTPRRHGPWAYDLYAAAAPSLRCIAADLRRGTGEF